LRNRSRRPIDVVSAGAAIQIVGAITTRESVFKSTAVQRIASGTSNQDVKSRPADERVVSPVLMFKYSGGGTFSPVKNVIIEPAVDIVIPSVAFDPVVAGKGRRCSLPLRRCFHSTNNMYLDRRRETQSES